MIKDKTDVKPFQDPLDKIVAEIYPKLKENLPIHEASKDAFVVSVYGEWGIGKTTLLKRIHKLFSDELDGRLKENTESPVYFPILFNPWQFEHEEHLIIPLIKTIEQNLYEKFKVNNGKMKEFLKETGIGFLALSTGLLSMFKVSKGPLEFSFKEGLGQLKETYDWLYEEKDKDKFLPQEQRSLYYDTHAYLKAITEKKPGISFILLIDDLDRCLPEKAVQMLESIKLFLNAPGFAYVLAIDDEVVERGINHRYKDYFLLPNADHHSTSIDTNKRTPPITGHEYLEKMIHLPLLIPRWSVEHVREFLVGENSKYRNLFISSTQITDKSLTFKEGLPEIKEQIIKEKDVINEELLNLFLKAIPQVPRKIIRAAESLIFYRDYLTKQIGIADFNPLVQLRLIILQQLFPDLYRLCKNQRSTYLMLFKTHQDEISGHFIYNEVYSIESLSGIPTANNLQGRIQTSGEAHHEFLHQYLSILTESTRNRAMMCPLEAFEGRKIAKFENNNIDLIIKSTDLEYFELVYLKYEKPLEKTTPETFTDSEMLPETIIANYESFLHALISTDSIYRMDYISKNDLSGRKLPQEVFNKLVKEDRITKKNFTDTGWLEDFSAITSAKQLMDFYREKEVLTGLFELNVEQR
jgi:hypothetical protein